MKRLYSGQGNCLIEDNARTAVDRGRIAAAQQLLTEKIEGCGPRYIAFLGKVAYAGMSRQRVVEWGPQPELFGGASVWVFPNRSGLNRSFSVDDLVCAYRELRLAVDGGDVALTARSAGMWQSNYVQQHINSKPMAYQIDLSKKTKPS